MYLSSLFQWEKMIAFAIRLIKREQGEGLGHHQEVRGGEQEGGAPDTEAAGARQREADNRRQVQVSRFKGNSSPNLNGFCIEILQ